MSPTLMDNSLKPIDILLVEDNLGDARLILETLKDGQVPNRLQVTKDGAKGLAYLFSCLEGGGPAWPDLILMDLNLPGLDGWELLRTLKGVPAFEPIPVVILTSSESEVDIRRSREMAAAAYLTKPLNLGAFLEAVQSAGLAAGPNLHSEGGRL